MLFIVLHCFPDDFVDAALFKCFLDEILIKVHVYDSFDSQAYIQTLLVFFEEWLALVIGRGAFEELCRYDQLLED